jgi:hypothetical protein
MMAGPSAITGKIAKATPTKPTPKTPAKSSSGLSAKQKAAIAGLGGITESLGALAGLVEKMGAGDSAGGTSGYSSDKDYLGSDRSGTSSTGKNYINGKLVSPEEFQKFLYGDKGTGADGGTDKAAADLLAAQKLADRKSAYDLLMEEFNRYGLGSLVEGIKGLVQENVSPSEFTIRLRQTDAYKKRFAANAQRVAKGLAAVSEAEYIGLEDQYQNVMRQYGLPDTYYTRGTTWWSTC